MDSIEDHYAAVSKSRRTSCLNSVLERLCRERKERGGEREEGKRWRVERKKRGGEERGRKEVKEGEE